MTCLRMGFLFYSVERNTQATFTYGAGSRKIPRESPPSCSLDLDSHTEDERIVFSEAVVTDTGIMLKLKVYCATHT